MNTSNSPVTPVLRLSDIRKRFGPTVALAGVDLDLWPGEVHALIGENGAGKSTLMNVVAGAFPPDSGEMQLAGEPYEPSSPRSARRQGVAFIHQELSLFPHLTVWENILMGIETAPLGWLDKESCRRRAGALLDNFRHPEIELDRPLLELSIGARQVVEICRALALEARIILMDEPTSSLQRSDVDRLFSLIRRLGDEGISVIYISHFLNEVREVADRCTVLRDGRSVSTGELSSTPEESLITSMVGRPVQNLFPPREFQASGELALEVRSLQVPPTLIDASFKLHRGEILGIAGLTGSGRTDMVRALFGLELPRSGEVLVRGKKRSPESFTPLKSIRAGIGYLSEDRKEEGLALSLSSAYNVTVTRLGSCASFSWIREGVQHRQALQQMKRVGVRGGGPADTTWAFSGGNQQKLVLARLLHQDADIFLLDEPTRGIDIGSKVEIYRIISQLAVSGKAVLMVSSDLAELFGLCHRLAVMAQGRLGPARPVREWTSEAVLGAALGTGRSQFAGQRDAKL